MQVTCEERNGREGGRKPFWGLRRLDMSFVGDLRFGFMIDGSCECHVGRSEVRAF